MIAASKFRLYVLGGAASGAIAGLFLALVQFVVPVATDPRYDYPPLLLVFGIGGGLLLGCLWGLIAGSIGGLAAVVLNRTAVPTWARVVAIASVLLGLSILAFWLLFRTLEPLAVTVIGVAVIASVATLEFVSGRVQDEVSNG